MGEPKPEGKAEDASRVEQGVPVGWVEPPEGGVPPPPMPGLPPFA